MAPIRALYLQPASSFGGAERQAAQNIRLLPRHGVEVIPILGPGREIIDFLEDAGVDRYLFRRDLPRDGKAPRAPLARAALWGGYVRAFFSLTEAVATEVRRERCQLLFASRPFAWVVTGFVGARLGLPVVWRAGTYFDHWSQPLVLSLFSRRHPPRAMVYTSRAVWRQVGPSVDAPSFVVHNGVDSERFSPIRHVESLRGKLGLAPEIPVVAFVGRIAPEKGMDLLVDMGRRLIERLPSVKLLVAGDSGWRPALAERCAAAGLGRAVKLLGFVRSVERVYATADVVVSTSSSEGCSNALLEAMAMGRPVVATRVGGTEEIVRDGVDGLLTPPGDAESLARAVEALLRSPDRRATIGHQAAARVRERFQVEQQVARLGAVLRWAAAEESAPLLDDGAG